MTIKTTIFTHWPRASLARFTFCWWRCSRSLMTSQWPDNCDAITWMVPSNSLDINFSRRYSRPTKKWAIVGHAICRHVASLCRNELISMASSSESTLSNTFSWILFFQLRSHRGMFRMVKLSHCGLMTLYGDNIWIIIGSGNGLLPDGTKPLPQPILIYH